MATAVLISEIFGPVIQGEGAMAGLPTIFVRTGGCDYRCSWCDTLYAVDAAQHQHTWRRMSAAEIAGEVDSLAAGRRMWVTLSGGNPAMWEELGEAVQLLQGFGHPVCIETQGTVLPSWAGRLNAITLSPKPPSSGMACNLDQVAAWVAAAHQARIVPVLKVVVLGSEDLLFAGALFHRFTSCRRYLQPCNTAPEAGARDLAGVERLLAAYDYLCEQVMQQGWTNVRVLPQLHVLTNGGGPGI